MILSEVEGLDLSSFVEEELKRNKKTKSYYQKKRMGEMGVTKQKIKTDKCCDKSPLKLIKDKVKEKEKNKI